MYIYIITLFILFFFSFLDVRYKLTSEQRKWLVFISYTVIVLQVGLRWETGTDWNSYLDHFRSTSKFIEISPFRNGMELGYNIFVWAIRILTAKYSIFLILHSVIFYLLIFKSFQRYTPYIFLTLLLFYSITLGLWGSNRQLIALAICLYSLRYIVEEKPVIFFALIFLATMFHISAILFTVYFFLNRNLKPALFVSVLIISFVLGRTTIPNKIFFGIADIVGGSAATKALFYINNANEYMSEHSLSIIGLVKRIAFLTVFYVNGKKLIPQLPFYRLLLNGYFLGIILYFLFSNSLLIMVSRGSLYFTAIEPLLLSSQLLLFNKKENKIVLLFLLFIFSFFFMYQSIGTYSDLFNPYKGLFLNSNYYRIMR